MFDTIIALGAIGLQVFIVIIIVAWIAKAPFASWVAKRSTQILQLVFSGAVIGSLIYSEVFKYTPCILCWYQRLVIYPTAILSFTGNLSKSALLRLQVLLLTSAGFAIALFHRYIEVFPNSNLTVCGADGVACDTLYVMKFGYITIPMMSLTVLLLGIILTILAGRYPQQDIVESVK